MTPIRTIASVLACLALASCAGGGSQRIMSLDEEICAKHGQDSFECRNVWQMYRPAP